MPSSIVLSDNGASSGSAGIKTSGGNDGVLILQTTTAGGTATNAVYVDTSQNVGFGTSSPLSQLHINGNSDSYFTSGLRVNRYLTAGQYGVANYANGTFNLLATDTALSSPAILFRTSTDGSTATERARVNTYGIGLGGAIPSSGTGITFPAAQSASTDANTLDDYEEGTWTPVDASGAGLTFTTSATYYTKIGNMVYVCGTVIYPSTANANGATIGGLPFTASGSATSYGGFSRYTNYSAAPSFPINASTASVAIYSLSTALLNSNVSTKRFDFVIVYQV